jgi:diguanylate cyclase (GGDEF)-like protein
VDPISAILNNIFLLIVLFSAYWYIRRQLNKGDFAHRTIRYIFLLAAVLLISDAVMRLNHSYGIFNDAICLISVLINTIFLPLISLLWFVYTCHATKLKIKLWIVYIISGIVFVINVVLAVLTILPNADIYYVFQDHQMILGTFYFVYAFILLLPFVSSLIVIFIQWNVMNRRRNPFTFFNFSVIPIIAIIGQFFYLEYSISLMGVVASFVIIVLDIQHQYAITDFLTGLYNRRNLVKYLTSKIKALRNGDKFAGFMLDINNFKSINDKYGHNFGDKVLIDVSNLLLAATAKGDYISRFGGDEFVLIIDIDNEEDIELFKQKLYDVCEKYNANESKTHKIDFSIGAALFKNEEGMSPSHFLEIIDDRMYIDKQSSKTI